MQQFSLCQTSKVLMKPKSMLYANSGANVYTALHIQPGLVLVEPSTGSQSKVMGVVGCIGMHRPVNTLQYVAWAWGSIGLRHTCCGGAITVSSCWKQKCAIGCNKSTAAPWYQ